MLRADVAAEPSRCFGTPERGRLERGVPLPASGPNFRSYTRLGNLLRRTYVHSTVAEIALDAYRDLATRLPSTIFVYGETSWASGGRLRPHRTHQNGTSVDFMVPVRDAATRSVPLPSTPFNRFGYDVEFDTHGRAGDLTIDFPAIAAHLEALQRSAERHGAGLRRVIFAAELRMHLSLAAPIPFTTRKPWIRHDEHYHVDFVMPCEPL